MNYYLTGVETNNKGAELMLYAILQAIDLHDSNAKIYIDTRSVKQGKAYIKHNAKLCLVSNPLNDLVKALKINGIMKNVFHKGLIDFLPPLPKIDYLIDGSGLHFSDQMFAGRKYQLWKRTLRKAKRDHAKIILLPQAFGPFKKETTCKTTNMVLNNADLVCARELVSYEMLKQLPSFDEKKIKVYTDFTSLVSGIMPAKYEHLRGGICIIPNKQMVKQGIISLTDYLAYISEVAKVAGALGKKVYLLNHQGAEDEELCFQCKCGLEDNVEVVTRLNALETKGIISTAYLVITSRFHGLASALNSGVPCLATSWSHKYKCLFEDYGQQNCVLSLNDIVADLAKIKLFLTEEENQKIRKNLIAALPCIEDNTRQMWKEVWSV